MKIDLMSEETYLKLIKNEYHYGVVYIVTNLFNGGIYVGQTTNFLKRKKDHLKNSYYENYRKINNFYEDIKSYGFNNFKWEIIKICSNQKELDEMEIKAISYYRELFPALVYNISDGGRGGNTYKNRPLEKNNLTKEKLSRAYHNKTKEEKEEINKLNSLVHKEYYKNVDKEKETKRKQRIKETKRKKSKEELKEISKKISIAIGVKVFCKELNMHFNSFSEAIEYIKTTYHTYYDNRYIKKSIKNNVSIKGFSWSYDE